MILWITFGQIITILNLNLKQKKNITNASHLDEKDLLQRLSVGRHDKGCNYTIRYPLGLIVNEKLLYDFGDEKVNEFWLAINQPSSWTDPSWMKAFSDTFGMKAEDWYTTSAIPYLLEVFD